MGYNIQIQMKDINLILAPQWNDYELIDTGNGGRLERFGKYIIARPDPQAIWAPNLSPDKWKKVDAWYKQEGNGKGGWIFNTKIPDRWIVRYKYLKFYVHLTPFKHTGIFPEQSVFWDWMGEMIKKSTRTINVLNLFAYTGGATLACANAGAKVTHLDASRPALNWTRDNQILSNLGNKPIRLIPDDALKFTSREIKRGTKYDAIIMDPPIYGHGAGGERWDFHKDFPKLLANCRQLLSDIPLFIIINAYAISASSIMLANLLSDLKLGGNIEMGELGLCQTSGQRILSTGIFARWKNN